MATTVNCTVIAIKTNIQCDHAWCSPQAIPQS